MQKDARESGCEESTDVERVEMWEGRDMKRVLVWREYDCFAWCKSVSECTSRFVRVAQHENSKWLLTGHVYKRGCKTRKSQAKKMGLKNANKKQLQKENAKKRKSKMHKNIKKCKCKNAMQNKYKSKIICCKFKNANCRKCFWTPAWFTCRGPAGYAVSVAWFSCIQVLEFASHAICARMSFSSVWVSVPASTLEWAHRFSGKGWWLAQPPSLSPKRCFSGKWGPISQGMTLPRTHLFCFFFAFVFFLHSDRGPSLSTGHLSTWQAWASTLGVLLRLHGFTSDLPFQV